MVIGGMIVNRDCPQCSRRSLVSANVYLCVGLDTGTELCQQLGSRGGAGRPTVARQRAVWAGCTPSLPRADSNQWRAADSRPRDKDRLAHCNQRRPGPG